MLKKQNKFADLFINIFKIITIIGNIVALIYPIMLIQKSRRIVGLIISFSILLFILLNIYFVVNNKKINKTKIEERKKSWIGLIIKRKTLEEKKKIADIENQLKLNN